MTKKFVIFTIIMEVEMLIGDGAVKIREELVPMIKTVEGLIQRGVCDDGAPIDLRTFADITVADLETVVWFCDAVSAPGFLDKTAASLIAARVHGSVPALVSLLSVASVLDVPVLLSAVQSALAAEFNTFSCEDVLRMFGLAEDTEFSDVEKAHVCPWLTPI